MFLTSCKKARLLLKTLLIIVLIKCNMPQAILAYPTTTANAVASPKKSYPLLFVMHAKDALLIKRSETEYRLILNGVYPRVNYTMSEYSLKDSMYETASFLKLWPANSNYKVQADITGIQTNNKTIGHTQFYTTALLNQPRYNIKKNQLTFKLKLFNTRINVDKYARFDNVTIFINGCTLCQCLPEKIMCDHLLLTAQ